MGPIADIADALYDQVLNKRPLQGGAGLRKHAASNCGVDTRPSGTQTANQ
jgi:hypothetical protein